MRRRAAGSRRSRTRLEVNAEQTSAVTALFAVGTLAEVAVKLEACKRRDELKAEIKREKAATIASNVAGSLEAARAILEWADAAALEAELAELKARAPHDDRAHPEAHSAHREAMTSAATMRWRDSRRSGAPSSRRSARGRAVILACEPGSPRRMRRSDSFAIGIAAR